MTTKLRKVKSIYMYQSMIEATEDLISFKAEEN